MSVDYEARLIVGLERVNLPVKYASLDGDSIEGLADEFDGRIPSDMSIELTWSEVWPGRKDIVGVVIARADLYEHVCIKNLGRKIKDAKRVFEMLFDKEPHVFLVTRMW